MPLLSSQTGSSFNPSTSYNQEQHFENGGHDVNSSSYDHKANFALITRLDAFDISCIHKSVFFINSSFN